MPFTAAPDFDDVSGAGGPFSAAPLISALVAADRGTAGRPSVVEAPPALGGMPLPADAKVVPRRMAAAAADIVLIITSISSMITNARIRRKGFRPGGSVAPDESATTRY